MSESPLSEQNRQTIAEHLAYPKDCEAEPSSSAEYGVGSKKVGSGSTAKRAVLNQPNSAATHRDKSQHGYQSRHDQKATFPETSIDVDLAPVADQLSAIAQLLRTGRLAALSRIVEGQSSQNGHQAPSPAGDPNLQHSADHHIDASDPYTTNAPSEDATSSLDFERSSQSNRLASADALSFAGLEGMRQSFGDLAREAYACRRKRAVIFGNPELFGEPAWDILLDLYVAHVDEKPVSVSSACIGSASPSTTGLRWLGILAEHELIIREHDPDDQRRVLVRLSEAGLSAMDQYFAYATASDGHKPGDL